MHFGMQKLQKSWNYKNFEKLQKVGSVRWKQAICVEYIVSATTRYAQLNYHCADINIMGQMCTINELF